MKKSLYLLTLLLVFGAARAQLVVQIDAGSRAPYGYVQSLNIDAKGNCKYLKYNVENGAVKDSASFKLTAAQLDTFFNKADVVGFYNLDSQYRNGVDGAGIYIALSHAGKKQGVDVKNYNVPQVDELIAVLNNMLQAYKIRIYYGQP